MFSIVLWITLTVYFYLCDKTLFEKQKKPTTPKGGWFFVIKP